MRFICYLVAACGLAIAADAPLVFSGAPMNVGYACVADDLRQAGLGCSEDEPCRVFLELAGLESGAGRVFLSGNLHTASTTLASILLETEDNGHTWREAWKRMPFTALDEIQFIDFEHGWIAGENVQTVARDPFLLITQDGGKNWQMQALFEADQPGAIQRFWFESAKEGKLLVDRGVGTRYELYKTRTGGENWEMERAAHEPIPFPGVRAKDATTVWRMRADARSSSWIVEQDEGAVWHVAALFATEVATCR